MKPGRAVVQTTAVLFGFTVFFLLFFSPVLFSDRFLGDAVDQLLEALPAYLGQHPLWEPKTMLGYPAFANPLGAYWYPIQLLRYIPRSYNAYEIIAFVISACGTYGLVRSLTGSVLAGIVGGFTYSLSGFMIGHIGHVDIIHPAAWVPFIFWALSELRQALRVRWIVMGALSVALCALAGQPQPFVYSLFLAVAFVAVFASSSKFGARAYVLAAALTLGLGAALAAISLVPTAELAGQSVRRQLSFDDFLTFEVPLVQIPLRMFFPYLLGQTVMPPYRYSAFNFDSFAEMSSYVGLTTICLWLVGIASCWKIRDVRFWAIVALVALLLSTGNALGLAFITYHLPLYNHFRAPGRHAMEVALAASVLSGFGVAAIENHKTTLRCVLLACAFAAAAMSLVLALLSVFSHLFHRIVTGVVGNVNLSLNPLENAALFVPFGVLVSGALALILFSLRPKAMLLRALLVIVVVLDLSSFGWFSYWHWAAFSPTLLSPPPYVATLKSELSKNHQRLFSIPTDDPRTGVAPNLNLLWDVPSARGYTPLELVRTKVFFDAIGLETPRLLLSSPTPLFGAAAIGYLIIPEPSAGSSLVPTQRGSAWRQISRSDGVMVLESATALPHAWIVHRVIGASSQGALAAIHEKGFDPRAVAVIEGSRSLSAPSASRGRDSVAILGLLHEKISLDVNCSAECFVVMSDAPYPGWTADVDGAETVIYTTDYALRGAFVAAGHHIVTMQFRPISLVIGATIAGAAIVGMILLCLVPLLSRRRSDLGVTRVLVW